MILFFILLWGPLSLFSTHFPSALSDPEWELIAPYILPDNHPVKPALDKIFAAGRPIRSIEALKKGGFKLITKGHWSDTIIATHADAPEFYFKMFTEDQVYENELPRLIARIRGALLAQEIIDLHGWAHLFKVPRKWLYLLPDDPDPIPGVPPKRMILLAEDMRLLSRNQSYTKWKSPTLNKKLLQAVFQLLTEGGFSDSAYAFNLPFARDGRIAIIDNDKHNKRPIPAFKLLRYLHPKSKKYWQELIDQAGPGLAF